MGMIDNIVEFVLKNSPYQDRTKIKEFILLHIRFNSFDFELDDKGEVIYVCRWNINYPFIDVLDLIVREEDRGKGFIKKILAKNLYRVFGSKFLRYKREIKRPGRKHYIIGIEEILR